MANFTQDRMYQMLSDINRKQKPTYKKGGLTKYEPGGAWPPNLKLKDTFLTAMPLYRNALASSNPASSSEIGLEGKFGKKKAFTIMPHFGLAYDSNGEDDSLVSGGIDLSYRGMTSPNKLGYAQVDMSANYNPETGFGIGGVGGYNFNFGRSKSRRGELKPGTMAGNIMPYAGLNYYQDSNKDMIDTANPDYHGTGYPGAPTAALIYGLKGGLEWRPRFGNKAPVTVFGKADVNFNPKAGSESQVESGLKFKPNVGATVGVKVPISRIKENLPSRKVVLPTESEDAVEPGDFTYKYRNEDGEFPENSNYVRDWDASIENAEHDFQKIDYTQKLNEDEYADGGLIKFADGGDPGDKFYNYSGIRYKRDKSGQWYYYNDVYKTWNYRDTHGQTIFNNGTPIYNAKELENLYSQKNTYLEPTTEKKEKQKVDDAARASKNSAILSSPILTTEQKMKHFSSNAPTIENAKTVQSLQAQKKIEDEKKAKEDLLKQQEQERQEIFRTMGSDNTRVNVSLPEIEIKDPIKEYETITKAQKAEAQRIVNNGDFAKHFPELREYYLSRENSHRPGGPLTMEEIALEQIRKNPNFLQTLEEKRYQDFQRREQETYDQMPWYMKGINAINALASDPITTLERALFEFERPLAFQGLESTDPSEFGEDARFYDRMLKRDENVLNNTLNYINPFRAASSAGQNLQQGDYGDALWDAATIIPMIKGAKTGFNVLKGAMKVNPTTVANLVKSNVINEASPLVQTIANKASVGNMLGLYGGYEGVTNNLPNAFDAYSQGDWKTGNRELFTGMINTVPLAYELNASKAIPKTVNAIKTLKRPQTPLMAQTSEIVPEFALASRTDDAAALASEPSTYKIHGDRNYRYEALSADDVEKLKRTNPNIATKSVTNDYMLPEPEQYAGIYPQTIEGQKQAFDEATDFALNWGVKDMSKYENMVANSDEVERLKQKIQQINNNPKNIEISQKASEINKIILDDFLKFKNKTMDDLLKGDIDMNDYAAFEQKKLGELIQQNPEVANIIQEHNNLYNRRQTLINKKNKLSEQFAASAEEAIDPTFKQKVQELYRQAGIPEDQIPQNAFFDKGTLIKDFGKDRIKLVEMNQFDPLSEPSFAQLPDEDQMTLANEWDSIGGVRTGQSTITLGSKVRNPTFMKVQKQPELVSKAVPLEPPREYSIMKPWTWKNRNFVPRVRYDIEEVFTEDPILVEQSNIARANPIGVGSTNAHEIGHDYQKFYNSWPRTISKYDSDLGYSTTHAENKLAERFKNAMVEGKIAEEGDRKILGKMTSETWASSPEELHSELMKSRYQLYLKMKAEKPELSQQQIIDRIKTGEAYDNAEIYDFYLQKLGKHFKETTSPRERKELIKLLPVLLPAAGYGIMEGLNQAGEPETPQNRYGGNIKTLSKFIRK